MDRITDEGTLESSFEEWKPIFHGVEGARGIRS